MQGVVENRIAAIIGPSVEAMGFDVVRVDLSGNRDLTLQIMVERKDRAEITVDHCADVSRTVSMLLDVEDPIQDAYNLEVSSPGIDRPLVRPEDFERFSGFEAKIELLHPVDGRKRWRGTVAGLDGEDTVVITVLGPAESDGEGVSFPFSEIKSAKLVLTDALIEASLAGRL